tara:strand:+ start:172 stop:792 length:621 start_codon:yes stop_codon:yes gene_type:complete
MIEMNYAPIFGKRKPKRRNRVKTVSGVSAPGATRYQQDRDTERMFGLQSPAQSKAFKMRRRGGEGAMKSAARSAAGSRRAAMARPPGGMKKGGMTKAKGMAGGGKMKTKGYMGGGKMKTKGYMGGGKMKTKGMAGGGKLPMVEKDGKMVPFFAADGKGKMQKGGQIRMSSKMMANGGMTAVRKKEGGNTVARGSGAARSQKFRKNG